MSIDYNGLTSIVSVVGVLTALIALIIENRRGRLALQIDIMMRLQDKLESQDMLNCRIIAAKKLLSRDRMNYELGDILNFFATIGFLYERRAIDTDLAYKEFSYWMIRYWLCAEIYIAQSRSTDLQSWRTLERIVQVLKL